MRKTDAGKKAALSDLFHAMMVEIGRVIGIGMVKVVNEYDLTFSQIIILSTLRESPQTVSSLSEVLKVTPGAVSRSVERMVRRGLVSRKEEDGDRRQKALTLTSAGKRMHDHIDQACMSSFDAAVSELDSSLAAELKDVLTRTVAALHPRGSAISR